MILRVVVYWLILLVCDVLSGEFIENYDNSSYWKLENMTVTKYPKVDNEHQTISIFKNIPNTESKISFNITILVNTSSSSGKQDNIIIAVVSTSNQTLNEFIKNAFFNMVLNNNMPQKKLLKLYRPWYAAFGKTSPPVIKPGKPWPVRPQEYYYLSLTANKKQQTTDKTKTPTKKTSNSNMIFTTSNQYQKVATEHLIKSSPASNRPFFAGLGTTRPPRIKPGKPWPAKLEDYANFSGTTDRNLNIVDRFQEVTTENPKMQTSIPNSIVLPPASDRPFFAGLGTTRPPRIKPGKPWPAKLEDYANFSGTTDRNLNIVDRFQEVTTENPKMQTSIPNSIVLPPASDRPFFAGLGTTRPPRIKPGKPWPAKPEDYANFNTTTDRNFNIVDRLQEVSTQKQNTLTTIPNTTVSTPASDRPFFAGLGTTRPPLIKPGKPWPAKPEDYANFNKTTDRNFNIVDRLQEVSTQKQNTQTIIPNTTVSTPASDRPFFAGLGTTRPPLIKPGKPWPAKPEDYANFNTTTDRNFNIVDRLQEVSTQKQNTQTIIPNTTVSTPASDRPFFAGLGTTRPPLIKPGKPWPAKPEDYANFNTTTDRNFNIVDRLQEVSTQKQNTQTIIPNTTVSTPASDRPFFAGLGTTRPPLIKPGKPWPAKPEDYANFNTTTDRNFNIVDRLQEVSTQKQNTQTIIPNTTVSTPASDRPFFAGLGTTRPPRIKPGKPWPAKPEDYANFNTTTDRNFNIVDRLQEVSTQKQNTQTIIPNTTVSTPASDRPFFAGLGTTRPPLIKPGKPWPAKPEDYANFNTTTDRNFNIVDRLQEVSTQKQNTLTTIPNTTVSTPASDRPFFAGLGTTRPPRIKPGKPWLAKSEEI